MPTYQMEKTYKSGFYDNWKDVNGQDMRVYTAQDMRKPYDVVFSDGIMPEADGTAGNMLKVSLLADMQISISKGHAKVGGAWFENTAPFKIALDAAESTTRYDCIIIRNDDTERVAEASIYIKSLYSVPTVANMVRTDKIYELCLAYVEVPAFAETISAGNIVDTREDGNLCNVMRGVGATVIRTYTNTYFTEAENQTEIPIGISQFDRTRDALSVIVEGRIMTAGTNYNIIDNEKITFNIGLPKVNTKIDFEVVKNVNAAGAETVIREVAELRKEITIANKTLEHHYYCNGINDNFKISEIVSQFQNGANDNSSMRLMVHGYFGATEPISGDGNGSSPFVWLQLAQNNASSRRVIVDFTDCREINIQCAQPTYNIIFAGKNANIVGANLTVAGGNYVYLFSTEANIFPFVENCRFWVTSNIGGHIAKSGTFKNCKVIHTVISGNAYSFDVGNTSLLRLIGGEYCAYANESYFCAVVRIATGQAGAVAILDNVSMPEAYKSGYTQVDCIVHRSGHLRCTDLITTLGTDVMSETSEFRGTIEVSKPNMM